MATGRVWARVAVCRAVRRAAILARSRDGSRKLTGRPILGDMLRHPAFLASVLGTFAVVPTALAQAEPPPPAGPAPGGAQPGYGGTYEPAPPPPPPPAKRGHKIPDFSVRVDPFNWLLEGRLGFELESEVWKFISFEVVPVFVANSDPPVFNLGSFPSELRQKSNGLGAMAGASFGAGFWLEGKPFEGHVLRAIFTNEGYAYSTRDDVGTIDEVKHTERRFFGYFGSHSRWGVFTIAGGIGLGVELNDEKRCFVGVDGEPTEDCSKDQLLVKLDRPANNVIDLNGFLHPAYLMARISLGFVF